MVDCAYTHSPRPPYIHHDQENKLAALTFHPSTFCPSPSYASSAVLRRVCPSRDNWFRHVTEHDGPVCRASWAECHQGEGGAAWLSFAQMRMRYNRWNLEIPKLLSVSFEDGEPSGDFKGSDILLLKVSVSLAELFGPGEWTAIDKRAVGYDGLQGWLSNFYAGHARGRWVDVAWLQKLSGYKSHIRNFRAGLVTALDKLKSEQVPEGCRVKDYHFSKDGEKLLVLRPGWTKPSEASV